MSSKLRTPPRLSESKNYESYLKLLKVWQIATELPKEKQGAALLLSLENEAQQAALRVDQAVLASEEGVTKVIEELDKIYAKDKTLLKYKALEDLENYKRSSNMNMKNYILEFETRLDETKRLGINWPDDIIAFRLLKNANLSETDHRLAKATVEELQYEKMKEKLISLFSDSELSSTTVKIEEININDANDDFDYQEDEIHATLYGNQQMTPNNRNFYGNRINQNNGIPQRNQYRQPYVRNNNRPFLSTREQSTDSRRSAQYQPPRRLANDGNYGARSYNNPDRTRNFSSNVDARGRNPISNAGQMTRCSNCQSINHWYSECPDVRGNYMIEDDEQTTLLTNASSEDIALFEADLDAGALNGLVGETLNAAVIDCGASKTCCGLPWWESYKSSITEEEQAKVSYETSKRSFKFGDGKTYPSLTSVKFPASIGSKSINIVADIVSANIPLLLSRESLKTAETKINFISDTAEMLGEKVHLITTRSGHYALPITKPRHLLQVAVTTNNYSKLRNTIHTTLQSSSAKMDVKKLALKLHRQFAHPPSTRLIKLIDSAGEPWSSNDALKEEIKSIEDDCQTCKLFKRPPPRPSVGLPRATKFLECIAMDIKFYKQHILLHMIDSVTRLSLSAVLKSKKPEVIIEAIFTHLIQPFGIAGEFFTDNGGEFANADFINMCEGLNICVRVTAGESPWSNGLVERHNLRFAEMLDNILADKKIDIKIALAWSLNAKNSLQNCHGFSPYQLSIGKNPILPCSFSDLPPALNHEATTDILRQNLEALHMAREAFIKAENAERLRRAARTNTRFANDPVYTTGDVVYFKRADNKKWHGPGTVIGREGSQILIKQGSYYVRVHTCRVMHAKKQRDSKENLAKSNTNQTADPKGSESNNIRSRKTANEPLASDSDEESSQPSETVSDSQPSETVSEPLTYDSDGDVELEEQRGIREHGDTSRTNGLDSRFMPIPVPKETNDLEQGNNTTNDWDQTDSPSNDSILNNSNPEGRDRSISDLCNRLANSFTDKAQPTDESSTKFKAIKKGAIVKFRGKDDEWHTCEVTTRSGKSKGKYKNAWNIIRDGLKENVDFERDVEDFEVLEPSTQEKEINSVENSENLINHLLGWSTSTEEIMIEESYMSAHESEVRAAKDKELESWRLQQVYHEVPNDGQQALSTTWVVTPKIIDGKYSVKARLCARGFEEEQFFRTDSPTCSREGIRITLALIACNSWKLKSLDIKTAFLQGKPMEREVYLQPPKEANSENLWLLKKCVYGLSDASRHWYLRVKEEMARLGGEVNKMDYGLFMFVIKGELIGILTCFVDDMIYGGTNEFDKTINVSMRKIFNIGTENDKSFNYVGIGINQDDDGSITIDQQHYIASLNPLKIDSSSTNDTPVTKEETKQFRAAVGKLNWLSCITCPEISFEVCWASAHMKNPTSRDVVRLNKVVRYVKELNSTIRFPRMDASSIEISSYSDASFNNLPNGGSQGGHIVFLNDRHGNSCPISWNSGRIKRVVRSTLAAETLALADSISTANYVHQLIVEVFPNIEGKQIRAVTDSKSIFDNVSTSHRVTDKGLVVDMNFIREIDRNLVNVQWVEGSGQLSDVLTKRGASPVALRNTLNNGSISKLNY